MRTLHIRYDKTARRGMVVVVGLMWLIGLSSCRDSEPSASDVESLLAAARQRLGGDEAVRNFESIRTIANVTGPTSEFTTGVWSARDGRARMEQTGGFVAGVHPTGNWLIDPATGGSIPLPDPTLAFIRGHELHAVVLAPESRYDSLAIQDTTTFSGVRAIPVLMQSPLDADAVAYYSMADSLPLGFRMLASNPDVVVTLDDWDYRDGLLIFTTAVFKQGEEEYRYDYVEVSLVTLADSVFRAPTGQP